MGVVQGRAGGVCTIYTAQAALFTIGTGNLKSELIFSPVR